MKGKLFLSGGGSEKDSYDFDKVFLKTLKTRKVLYIPLAMEIDAAGYKACYDWITNSLTQFSDEMIEIIMCLDLKKINKDYLKQFAAVYIGGGNTYRLLDRVYSSCLDKDILKYINDGGVFYGGSAGAIIMGKSIDTVIEENTNKYKYSKGLNILGNYSLIAHYGKNINSENLKVRTFISKYKTPVLAIPEGSGLIVENKVLRTFGKKPVRLFN